MIDSAGHWFEAVRDEFEMRGRDLQRSQRTM
jgi:hypothetical protein